MLSDPMSNYAKAARKDTNASNNDKSRGREDSRLYTCYAFN